MCGHGSGSGRERADNLVWNRVRGPDATHTDAGRFFVSATPKVFGNGVTGMSALKKNPSFEKSAYEPLNERILIGIDPGVNTGFAVWSRKDETLINVETYSILDAQAEVLRWKYTNIGICLIIEDARKRKWFGPNAEAKRQGAGSVKRDCKLWEDFCNREGIPFRLVHPKRGATKVKTVEFQALTGWRGRTSVHARDAAMLVVGRGRF